MRIIYSAHKLGELKEAIEKDGGISFKFDVNDAFVDMIKRLKRQMTVTLTMMQLSRWETIWSDLLQSSQFHSTT